eukprot:TRINITY_DN11435_c0_g3_i1.p1 TRINITY_DN11435_c0_g3~~TRINITY_DN11435_c0_g3_i1.p1  ORF type:complete len:225 (-),score=37.07 TRINITY_DN11435_c0_g3_i1:170-844(-)
MSKTLSQSLYDAFEKYGVLKLRADLFIDVLRSVGAPMSPSDEDGLIEWLGKDSEDCVDVTKFCARFEGKDQATRVAQHALMSWTPSVTDGMVQRPLKSDNAIDKFLSADRSPSDGQRSKVASSTDEMRDVVGLENCNGGKLNASSGVDNRGDRPALTFSRQVTADDDSVWSLGGEGEDKCTSQSRRCCEGIVAEQLASVNGASADLTASAAIDVDLHLSGLASS